MNVDQRLGPCSLRVWFLILNLIANGIALYGMAEWLEDGSGLVVLLIGVVLTLLCIGVLSTPRIGR